MSGFAGSLVLIHHTLAELTRLQQLEMTVEEAALVLDAAGNVARHYDISFLSQKALDWTALVNVLAMVYGSRIIAIRAARGRRSASGASEIPPSPGGAPTELVVSEPRGFDLAVAHAMQEGPIQ